MVGEIFFVILILCVIGIVLVLFFLNRMTSNKLDDELGPPDEEYKEYLRQSGPRYRGLEEIPPPPNGERDKEVETLLRSGDYPGAHQLLIERMEEARLAPVGSQARIARVSHYMEQLEQLRMDG